MTEVALLWLVGITIAVALAFDFTNGFHDAANSIATSVATGVLKPRQAVLWAAFFNFAAAFFFGLKIAATIGKGVVDPTAITHLVVLAALLGAITWNLVTWLFGMPTSSSHALIGAIIGATVAHTGFHPIKWAGIEKIATFIVIAPLFGMLLGYCLKRLSAVLLAKCPEDGVDKWSRRMQLVSSALYSLGHGANDAQKTMGVIAVLLVVSQAISPTLQHLPHWAMPAKDMSYIPWWIILSAHAAMALGTLAGGWRIVNTMAYKITELKPLGGCCAEAGGAATLFLASHLGVPVSTTQTITGSIVGVGIQNKDTRVQWPMVGRILWAWVGTIPGAALLGWALYHLVSYL